MEEKPLSVVLCSLQIPNRLAVKQLFVGFESDVLRSESCSTVESNLNPLTVHLQHVKQKFSLSKLLSQVWMLCNQMRMRADLFLNLTENYSSSVLPLSESKTRRMKSGASILSFAPTWLQGPSVQRDFICCSDQQFGSLVYITVQGTEFSMWCWLTEYLFCF